MLGFSHQRPLRPPPPPGGWGDYPTQRREQRAQQQAKHEKHHITRDVRRSCSSFLRGYGPQISNEIVKVTIGHGRIKWEAHRRLKLGPVFALAPRDGALDLRIGPGANALLLVRGDVARHRHTKGPFELLAALTEIVHEVMPVIDHRRVALHAMRDGRDIEAALDGRIEIGGRHLLVGAGGNIDVHHGLVDRRLHLVAHWRVRSYKQKTAYEIARGED